MAHDPLPQDAFRSRPVSDEDKYFARREQEMLEDLRDARAARAASQRTCPCPECQGAVLERIMQGKIEIDRCPKCKGVWLDAGELEIMTARVEHRANKLSRFFRQLAGVDDYDE